MAEEYKPPEDLLDYLWQRFEASGHAPSEFSQDGLDHHVRKALQQFLGHARETLRKNQPVAMDFLSDTPSLRFQDALVLPIVTFPEGQRPGMEGLVGYRPVSKGAGGGMAPSQSWGVTGEQK